MRVSFWQIEHRNMVVYSMCVSGRPFASGYPFLLPDHRGFRIGGWLDRRLLFFCAWVLAIDSAACTLYESNDDEA